MNAAETTIHVVQGGEGVVSLEMHEDHGARGEMGNQLTSSPA